MRIYPLKFHPILKERLWGGTKLEKVLQKPIVSDITGESWELSAVSGDVSVVSNGELANTSLRTLIDRFPEALLGKSVVERFGKEFPILIKFIDAKQDLSIQLHPNDELANKRHNSFGKTEMWYVMQADEDANLIVGFNQKVTPEKYLEHLENKTLTEILNFDKVKQGDTYFIEVGRVHAIGAGVMLAEIQQTSDVTYRVYDWDRVDDEGNERELHNDLAIDAIDFNMPDNFRVSYSKTENKSNEMVTCPYFTTNYLEVNGVLSKKNSKDSFFIYMCVGGDATITYGKHTESIKVGETILMPADAVDYQITSKNAKFLEVHV